MKRPSRATLAYLVLAVVAVFFASQWLRQGDEPTELTLTEFRLLESLIQASGRVLSRSALMSRAMGPGVTVTERTIDVHITAIRKKLGDHAGIIKTVRGVGYRATPELETADPETAGVE